MRLSRSTIHRFTSSYLKQPPPSLTSASADHQRRRRSVTLLHSTNSLPDFSAAAVDSAGEILNYLSAKTIMSSAASLKEYLKRYQSNPAEDENKKKKKKKANAKPKVDANGVIVVDEDPVWQKAVKLDEEENDDSPDEQPTVEEDVEVKRMKRLEQLRARRPYHGISEDGSGWVTVSDLPKQQSTATDLSGDISPPRRGRTRNDTPSPKLRLRDSNARDDANELSPPRRGRTRNDTLSPKLGFHDSNTRDDANDLSPPRRGRTRNDTPSPRPGLHASDTHDDANDFSPPRQRRKHYDSPSINLELKPSDLSPRRRSRHDDATDPSPPWQRRRRYDSPSSEHERKPSDLSPPRRSRHRSPSLNDSQNLDSGDLSPPRKNKKVVERLASRDSSSHRSRVRPSEKDASHSSVAADLSPPRKIKEKPKTGLVSGKDIKEEITKAKKDELLRLKEMDPSISGRGAEPVFRDKTKGERISKDEFLKSQKKEEKPKEIKVEWGKGLAQKREAEEKLMELELEKDKPFARSRDDPELDAMLKERVRWGDPMAHLVKKKRADVVLPDLGENEKMKESGFIVPQDIPSHSWLKRGLEAAPNRYGIRPGRHWDGVDRSNGYEKELFKRMNEKQATQREAYLWSVSDM